VVATFDPVVDPVTGERLVQFPLDAETDCPVEPVPASVAVGPDGAYYVGELTGTTAENFVGMPTPEGIASVWRVEAGSRDVVCPSAECVKAVTGLNSVIDVEFGPDGYLYVVEYERNGFLATVAPAFGIPLAGGTVKRCDVGLTAARSWWVRPETRSCWAPSPSTSGTTSGCWRTSSRPR
jgi:hypothetical protein